LTHDKFSLSSSAHKTLKAIEISEKVGRVYIKLSYIFEGDYYTFLRCLS